MGSQGYVSFSVVQEIPGQNNDISCNYTGTAMPGQNKITGGYVCTTGPLSSGGGDWVVYRTGN
jgi:hypothetical protein